MLVVQEYKNGPVKTLKSYEGYQEFKKQQIFGDTLDIILADTVSYVQRIDTLKIKIPELSQKPKVP